MSNEPIVIIVSGGVVQEVENVPSGTLVEIRDYDNGKGQDADDQDFFEDDDGEVYQLGVYGDAVTKESDLVSKNNTMFDVAFSLEHDCKDPEDVPVASLLSALRQRLQYLEQNPDEAREAFDVCDTYENYPD